MNLEPANEPDLVAAGALGPVDIAVVSEDTVYTFTGLQFSNTDIEQSAWTYA